MPLSIPPPWPADEPPSPKTLLNAWYQFVLASPVVGRLAIQLGFAGRILQAARKAGSFSPERSEEHTSELHSRSDLVCRLLLEKKKNSEISHSTAVPPSGVRASVRHRTFRSLRKCRRAPLKNDTETHCRSVHDAGSSSTPFEC